MAKVYIKNDDKEVEVPDGSELVILDGKCSILYACKTGSCASCIVKVLEGKENLEEPNDIEKMGLENFATDPDQRLLCQAKIKGGKVVVEY